MSKITDDDVLAMIDSYRSVDSWTDGYPTGAGMRAAAEEIERRVIKRVNAQPRPMHEPVSEAEAKEMIDAIHYGKADSFFERVRSAGNGLLAKRAGAEPKSAHEPVTREEAKKALHVYYEGEEPDSIDDSDIASMRSALTDFLARRAAATLADVVVVDNLVAECMDAIGVPDTYANASTVHRALHWLADRLNGKHAPAPVDPRVELVRDWAQSYSIEPEDESIAELIAKFDARKP